MKNRSELKQSDTSQQQAMNSHEGGRKTISQMASVLRQNQMPKQQELGAQGDAKWKMRIDVIRIRGINRARPGVSENTAPEIAPAYHVGMRKRAPRRGSAGRREENHVPKRNEYPKPQWDSALPVSRQNSPANPSQFPTNPPMATSPGHAKVSQTWRLSIVLHSPRDLSKLETGNKIADIWETWRTIDSVIAQGDALFFRWKWKRKHYYIWTKQKVILRIHP